MIKNHRRLVLILGVLLLIIIALSIYLFGAPKIKNVSSDVEKGAEGTSVLVVYFSRNNVIKTEGIDANSSASISVNNGSLAGNTEIFARYIRKETGADLFSVRTARYYYIIF